MAVPFPAWLDTNPSGEFQASEAGARMGLQAQAIQERGAAAAAADQARQLQAQTRAQAMEYSANLASHDREMKLQEAQLANDNAQKMALIGLQQQDLNVKIQQAQQKFQANQTYQQLTASGMDPVDAALQVGPGLLGESTGGLASMSKADATSGFTPTSVTLPDGTQLLQTSPNRYTQAKLPDEWKTVTLDDGTQVQENTRTHKREPMPGTMTETQRENMEMKKKLAKNTIINKVMDEDVKDALDSGTGIDKAWSDRKKKLYVATKKQLDSIDSGTGTASTSSGAQFKYNPNTQQLEPVDQTPQADTE